MTNAPVRNEHEPVAVSASIAARLIRRVSPQAEARVKPQAAWDFCGRTGSNSGLLVLQCAGACTPEFLIPE